MKRTTKNNQNLKGEAAAAPLNCGRFYHNLKSFETNAFAKLMNALVDDDECIVVTDKQGKIICVNQAFESMTGYKEKEAKGQQLSILKSGRHSQDFYKQLWRSILAGHNFHDVLINRRKNGHLYYQLTTIKPIKDDQEQISNFILIGRDITEQYLNERQLQIIGKIAQPMIDKINLPVSQIQAAAVRLKAYVSKQKSLEPYKDLNTIYRTSRQISKVLKIFSTFIVVNSDSSLPALKIKATISDIVKNFKRNSDQKKLKIKLSFKGRLGALKLDQEDLEFVIAQLLEYALGTEAESSQSLAIEVGRKVDELEITFKGQANRQSKSDTGIELLLVEKILAEYQGSVECDTKDGKLTINLVWPGK